MDSQALVVEEQAGLPAIAAELVEKARGYAAGARSESTLAAYATDWADFEAFCATLDVAPMPADPAVVALYIAERAETLKPSTIDRRLAAVSAIHKEAGHVSPTSDQTVKNVRAGMRRDVGVAKDQAPPLRIGEVRRIVAGMDRTSAIGKRDAALILVGFACALRRSELVALTCDDIEDHGDDGVALLIRSSKTDQAGEGMKVPMPYGADPSTCPIGALRDWIDVACEDGGPVFRGVDRHGNIRSRSLSGQAVDLVVKRATASVGLEGFSAHSLRAGFATTAAANGATERSIAKVTRHRSMDVLRGYIREGELFRDTAAGQVGL